MALIFPVQAGILVAAVAVTGLAFSQLPLTFWVGHALFALAWFAWGWIREHDFVFMPRFGYGNFLLGAACLAWLYLFCDGFGWVQETTCVGGRARGKGRMGWLELLSHVAPVSLTMGTAILTGYLFRPRI